MAIRTFVVSRAESGRTVTAVLRGYLSLPWSAARRLVRDGRVRLGGVLCRDAACRVNRGQHLRIDGPALAETRPVPSVGPKQGDQRGQAPLIRYADQHLVVVDKPPGLTTMRHPEEAAEFGRRARRFLPPTLADLLPKLLTRLHGPSGSRVGRVRAVHRLDKETSGLVVFARTPEAERHLGQQFRAHTIDRCYLAVVRGQAVAGCIESSLVRDRGDGRRGSATQPQEGKPAVTCVRVVENLVGCTLVECQLKTGRTHQVRIHLGEQGTPLCGERVYDRPLHGAPLPDASGAPRLALHAAKLGFAHPATGKRMTWSSPLPPDLKALVQRLRQTCRQHSSRSRKRGG